MILLNRQHASAVAVLVRVVVTLLVHIAVLLCKATDLDADVLAWWIALTLTKVSKILIYS